MPIPHNSNDNSVYKDEGFKAGYEALLTKPKNALLESLIVKSRALLRLAEQEKGFLQRHDMTGFVGVQREKNALTEDYAQNCKAFHARLEEFRGMAPALLDRLEALQERLGEVTQDNNKEVSRLMNAASENTSATLLAAQEIGQIKNNHSE